MFVCQRLANVMGLLKNDVGLWVFPNMIGLPRLMHTAPGPAMPGPFLNEWLHLECRCLPIWACGCPRQPLCLPMFSELFICAHCHSICALGHCDVPVLCSLVFPLLVLLSFCGQCTPWGSSACGPSPHTLGAPYAKLDCYVLILRKVVAPIPMLRTTNIDT